MTTIRISRMLVEKASAYLTALAELDFQGEEIVTEEARVVFPSQSDAKGAQAILVDYLEARRQHLSAGVQVPDPTPSIAIQPVPSGAVTVQRVDRELLIPYGIVLPDVLDEVAEEIATTQKTSIQVSASTVSLASKFAAVLGNADLDLMNRLDAEKAHPRKIQFKRTFLVGVAFSEELERHALTRGAVVDVYAIDDIRVNGRLVPFLTRQARTLVVLALLRNSQTFKVKEFMKLYSNGTGAGAQTMNGCLSTLSKPLNLPHKWWKTHGNGVRSVNCINWGGVGDERELRTALSVSWPE